MKIDKFNPRHWYYLALQGVLTAVAIVTRPFVRRPGEPHIVVLYGHQFSGHLAAIYRYWRKNNSRSIELYYLSLDPSPVLTNGNGSVDTLYCNTLKDMLILSKASAIVTDHGLHMMKPLAIFTDIVFIDVGHGVPFKGYDEDTFSLQRRYYTEMWVSSQGVADIYANKCGCGHIVHSVGSPRTDRLVQKRSTGGNFRQYQKLDANTTLILYAPTWQQDDPQRTLIPFRLTTEEFMRRFSTFCTAYNACLVFRSHQNATFSEADYPRIIFCPQSDYPDTEDLLLDTNILISDWSSIVFDFMVLERPTIFLDVAHPFAKGCTLGPEYRFGYIAQSVDKLFTELQDYIRNPDKYHREYGKKHRRIQEFVYDDNADGNTCERCIDRLQTLVS